MRKEATALSKAVIYCRVSSERQVREGDGLNSQETRCHELARFKNLTVEKIFKEEAISGVMTGLPIIEPCLHACLRKPVFLV